MVFLKKIFEDKFLGEHHKGARWLMGAYIIGGFVLWAILIMIFPISYWVSNDFNMAVFSSAKMDFYFKMIYETAGFYVLFEYYKCLITKLFNKVFF